MRDSQVLLITSGERKEKHKGHTGERIYLNEITHAVLCTMPFYPNTGCCCCYHYLNSSSSWEHTLIRNTSRKRRRNPLSTRWEVGSEKPQVAARILYCSVTRTCDTQSAWTRSASEWCFAAGNSREDCNTSGASLLLVLYVCHRLTHYNIYCVWAIEGWNERKEQSDRLLLQTQKSTGNSRDQNRKREDDDDARSVGHT